MPMTQDRYFEILDARLVRRLTSAERSALVTYEVRTAARAAFRAWRAVAMQTARYGEAAEAEAGDTLNEIVADMAAEATALAEDAVRGLGRGPRLVRAAGAVAANWAEGFLDRALQRHLRTRLSSGPWHWMTLGEAVRERY